MSQTTSWSTPSLIPLGAAMDDARNGNPSQQNVDAGSDLYAS